VDVRVLAPAKVNPWLEVHGRRDDGYHELDTVMLAIDLCDVVVARAVDRPGVRIAVDGPFASADVPRDATNLAAAAAQRVLSASIDAGVAPRERGLELRLTKNIPSRAGLGGGSSDAAAAWFAAERALEFSLTDESAERGLATLGSDCVFFRAARATGLARCTGRGERVAPWPAAQPGWWLVVLAPALEAPTAAVYAALAGSLRKPAPAPTLRPDVFERSESDARSHLFNRLEDACFAVLPPLTSYRALLDACGASHFRLSGSGSSFFGLYRDRGRALGELAAIETACNQRGLACRGLWLVEPARSGVRLVSSA
jgi:4-diphosphocytidyl-2-C-methyl-D-erythritol kinase